mmetsp:Transcript_65096/g.164065  ORF Transcript_65096/g.164065 Transcript_65096/m.164065 type:complete len:201 (-) Transcript_65096:238-840(-)
MRSLDARGIGARRNLERLREAPKLALAQLRVALPGKLSQMTGAVVSFVRQALCLLQCAISELPMHPVSSPGRRQKEARDYEAGSILAEINADVVEMQARCRCTDLIATCCLPGSEAHREPHAFPQLAAGRRHAEFWARQARRLLSCRVWHTKVLCRLPNLFHALWMLCHAALQLRVRLQRILRASEQRKICLKLLVEPPK